jgi:macrolide transport system ATP-binding/permease protein
VYDAAAGRLAGAGTAIDARVPSLASLGLLPSADVHRPVTQLSVGLVDELTEALTVTAAAVVVATHDRHLLDDVLTWPRVHLAD